MYENPATWTPNELVKLNIVFTFEAATVCTNIMIALHRPHIRTNGTRCQSVAIWAKSTIVDDTMTTNTAFLATRIKKI
jgi:hypothetical protein